MTVPYLPRLLCLSAAAFFLLHTALALAVTSLAGHAVRLAEAMAPRAGARLLLALRLLPAAAAALLVAAVCAPSYFLLEPEATAEHAGLVCLLAAGFAVWAGAAGVVRAARAVVRSTNYLRRCRGAVETDAPVLLLAGILRPRLVVSRGVRKALAPDQLAAALRHERAHRESHDNLKRLLLLAAPSLPFHAGLRRLERGWARLAEWAADDRAAAGNPHRSLALAAALVRVARMGTPPQPAPLVTSLMADTADLGTRVDRLLTPPSYRQAPWLMVPAALGLAAVGVVAAHPGTMYAVHRALEVLMR